MAYAMGSINQFSLAIIASKLSNAFAVEVDNKGKHMITTYSGVNVWLRHDPYARNETRTQMGRSFDSLIKDFEKETGEKVKGVEIDPEYGLMFILE
jgi:hypothetical protein